MIDPCVRALFSSIKTFDDWTIAYSVRVWFMTSTDTLAAPVRSTFEANPERPEKHLIIAGTGRSGTSFLVRFLSALGLDTALARYGEAAGWDLDANAGLENFGLSPEESLPYVIKSPWIAEYVEKLLGERRFQIDAFILPMRNLVDAAASRAIVELRAIHQSQPWMAECLDRSWETFAHTPGGIVYSLNPLDQARLLAVQFHQLILRVSERQIPIFFPVFPRMASDWEYLYRCLAPVLPAGVTSQMAREAHESVADRSKVRTTDEMRNQANGSAAPHVGSRYPSSVEVDNIALRREIARLRMELASVTETRVGLERHSQNLQSELAAATEARSDLERQRENLQSEIAQLNRAIAGKTAAAASNWRVRLPLARWRWRTGSNAST